MKATRLLASASVDVATAAPFSVLRTAIESAAAVVWLLGPDEPVERQLRCLQLTLTDREDFERFMDRRSQDHRSNIKEFRVEVLNFARTVTRNPQVQIAKIWMTRILQYAAEATPGIGDVLSSWQMCSAFAHGRSWSVALLAPDTEVASSNRMMSPWRLRCPICDTLLHMPSDCSVSVDEGMLIERSAYHLGDA
ncbi:hypothetical protein [Saccharothrix stipae]